MHNYLILLFCLFISACMTAPRPLTLSEIEQRATDDYQTISAKQESITGSVTLFEAMARAVKYNLDYRIKRMEEALAAKQFDVSQYDLLPRLAVSAGYSHRNNYSGAYSQSLLNGRQSLEASTSQERDIITTDIAMMWNVMDFGISYINARQQADRFFIAQEMRRKAIQNILQELQYAYWRAAAADALLPEMKDLLRQANSALEYSRQIETQRLQPPLKTLEYQRSLLENIRLLRELIQRLVLAKTELAMFMNISPDTGDWRLETGDWGLGTENLMLDKKQNQQSEISFQKPASSIQHLEHLALTNRPELREEDYRKRISELEARKAIMHMLPNIELNMGYNTDSNDFLYHQDWWNVGARIALNLFNLFSGSAAYETAKLQIKADDIRRQAMSMAVLTQVHLAYQQYHLTKEEYRVICDLDNVNTRLKDQMMLEKTAGRVDDAAVIQTATNALVAKMRRYLIYAELQNAKSRIYHSIGIDFFPPEMESSDIASLADVLEHAFNEWNNEINICE